MQRLLTIAVAVLAFHSPAHREWGHCRAGDTHACVWYVIDTERITGVFQDWMLRVPGCESTWEADPPHNNDSRGLYQFLPSTWAGTPYGHFNILDPLRQAQAAAYVYRRDGGGSEWACR